MISVFAAGLFVASGSPVPTPIHTPTPTVVLDAVCTSFKDIPNKFEASGAAYVNGLVYSVGDEGHLAAWNPDGSFVGKWDTGDGDFEGLTVTSQSSNYLYLAQEYPATIHQWSLETNRLTGKKWTLPNFIGDQKHGMEGLTYVASEDVWYAGSQYDAGVYQYQIDLTASGEGKQVGSVYYFGLEEVSGLGYDFNDGTVYAVSDSDDKFIQFDTSGKLLREGQLQKSHWEGIVAIGDGRFALADDAGNFVSCTLGSSNSSFVADAGDNSRSASKLFLA